MRRPQQQQQKQAPWSLQDRMKQASLVDGRNIYEGAAARSHVHNTTITTTTTTTTINTTSTTFTATTSTTFTTGTTITTTTTPMHKHHHHSQQHLHPHQDQATSSIDRSRLASMSEVPNCGRRTTGVCEGYGAGPRRGRVTSCPRLPGTVPEWDKMSRVPVRSIPGK